MTKIITAALPYINNVPHLGHIAGSHLPGDIYNRFCKIKGEETLFVGGSDVHGTPSLILSKEIGISPEVLTVNLHKVHKKLYDYFNISYDNYSKTSSPVHKKKVQNFFTKLDDNGYIQEKTSVMKYCEHDKLFLPDRLIEGTCPNCGYENSNGDQCEKCGSLTESSSLLDSRCKLCGNKPIEKEDTHLYFSLDKVSNEISDWIKTKEENFNNITYSEAQNWLNKDLHPRSITRNMTWGIPVPKKMYEDKVFYVWFEAPIAYISFIEEINHENLWENKNTKIYHFLGKDNIPFHTIFWPGLLIGNGEYNTPNNVIGYNYLTYENEKFSKSKGVGIFCINFLNCDINIDSLRAYLTHILPEKRDSNFSLSDYKNFHNSELIGKIFNFFNRSLNMVWKNFHGKIKIDLSNDLEIISKVDEKCSIIMKNYETFSFRSALSKVIELASMGNIYFDNEKPWESAKNNDLEKLKEVLGVSMYICEKLIIFLNPILPTLTEELWEKQLQKEEKIYCNKEGLVTIDLSIEKPYPILSRIDDDQLQNYEKVLTKEFSLKNLIDEEIDVN